MKLYTSKPVDYFSAARADVLELCPSCVNRVLEVGCGEGQTLELLKKGKRCAETIGFELMPLAAQAASQRADRVYCLNVEQDVWPVGIGKFDLILLLDVLEHLVDPWSLLEKLKNEYLEIDGKLVISLPNAQHFSLLLPLLAGQFNYVESGILDKTHLRFFTKKSAIDLLHSAGLTVEAMQRTSLDIRLNSGKLNAVTLGIFKNFLTSQYVFRACAQFVK